MYREHLMVFERAIAIRVELEDRIRMLEKLESDKLTLMKADYEKREESYKEIIRMIQEDYERFKLDTVREFDIKDLIIKRHEGYNEVLRKEILIA